jgi:zinc and cadmium transporter
MGDLRFLFIILATLFNGLVALFGAVVLLLPKRSADALIKALVAFAAGALFGGALFHLTTESLEKIGSFQTFSLLTGGFIFFFILERYLWWHHCHKGECETHPVSYLVLIGDGVHNFIDGLIIATSFMLDLKVGIITTLLIIFHEVPQELGDFAVLIDAGFSRKQALLYNFLSQMTALVSAVASYFAFLSFDLTRFLLPIAAGGFLYISASDLIPEVHRHSEEGKALVYFLLFVLGIAVMIGLKFLGE